VKHWINTRVTINDRWGPGSDDSLNTPMGELPEFRLQPRYLRDAQGTPRLGHFSIEFPSGYLADGWQGVNFTPLGEKPVTGISGLLAYGPAQKTKYRDVISAAAGSLRDAHTARLEAVIGYVGLKGQVGYNKVRLFYVPDAVAGPTKDLVVVTVVTHVPIPGTVHASQDGNAHGPPG